jgi:zinc protease
MRNLLLLLVCFQLSTITLPAQVNLQEKLPLNPKVKTGQLKNGLKYYILENKMPEKRAELRLVVNAGSINEDEDQLGLAHMAEHMAFNGTKNFRKNEIISFLQDIGVGFGNDLNAYTSFNETVYILPIPLQNKENLEKGMQVLEDWAHQVSYMDEDINDERAIILEESRLGKGADDRLYRQLYPKLFAGSRYAERLPIGKDSIISNFHPDAIRRFYKDWYRPDLMAVIVVGDIDTDEVEAMIKKHFSKIKKAKKPRERAEEKMPPYEASSVLVATDHEAIAYSIGISYPFFPADKSNTLESYRNYLIESLLFRMFNQRLQELVQQENAPFVTGNIGSLDWVRGYKMYMLNASPGTGDVRKALNALAEEMERAIRFGFTGPEFERAKKSLIANYERSYNNRDKTSSAELVDELIGHFLEGEPVPGIEKEFEYVQQLLHGITLDEVNRKMEWFKQNSNRVIYILGPDKAEANLPTEAEVLQSIAAVESRQDIQPYEEKLVSGSLMEELPAGGKVVNKTVNEQYNATEITLSNGVKVTLKPTTFKNDEILMSATRFGGKSLYGEADKYNAEYAVQIVSAMGVGNFSPTDLRKMLAGKNVSVSPSISTLTEGVRGSSVKKDLETMLQLTYLYLTNPRKDTALFNSFINRNKLQYANIGANPQVAFLDTMYAVLYQNHPLAPVAIPKSSNFEKVNLDRALEIYKERFADAAGLHFVFVGSFDEAEIIPLLEQYLGALPTVPGTTHEFADNQVRMVKGKEFLKFHKGKEKQSLILAFYNGQAPYSEEFELNIAALSEILNIRIIEELREKVQGIYGGGTSGALSKYPIGEFNFVLQLPCGPEKVDTLIKASREEFRLMMEKGPDPSYLKKVKEQWKESYRANIQQNNYWLEQITQHIILGKNPDRFVNYEKYVDALTEKDIQEAAKLVFGSNNEFIAVLMPEEDQ